MGFVMNVLHVVAGILCAIILLVDSQYSWSNDVSEIETLSVQIPGVQFIEFVKIPPGKVLLGCGDEEFSFESQNESRIIDVDEFFISKFEISIQSWKSFIDAGGYKTQDFWGDKWDWMIEKGMSSPRHWEHQVLVDNLDTTPVRYVTLYEVSAFINWLNSTGNYEFAIPTESEWEYAAEGNAGINQITLFPWGDFGIINEVDYEDVVAANLGYSLDGQKRSLAQSGSFPLDCSWAGVFDLAGNVSEWCISDTVKGYVLKGGNYALGVGIGNDFLHGSSSLTGSLARTSFSFEDANPEFDMYLVGVRLVIRPATF